MDLYKNHTIDIWLNNLFNSEPLCSGFFIIVDQYSSEKYAYDDIVGEADYFRGFDHLKIIPGLRLKSSFALDFASSGLFIRAIHSGLTLDIYPKKLQIMDQTPNKQIYFGGFIGFLIGDLY